MKQNEILSAQWSARLVIIFIGLPSLACVAVLGLFNISFASRLSHSASLYAVAVLVTWLVAGLPLAIEILRAKVPSLATGARVLWGAALVFSAFAAIAYSAGAPGHIGPRSGNGALMEIGETITSPDLWGRILALFVAAMVELGAALGVAITARTVAELLNPQEAPVLAVQTEALDQLPVKVAPEVAFQMWFGACVSIVNGGRIAAKDAYDHWESWAARANVAGSLTYVAFGRLMCAAVEAVGGKVAKSNTRFYNGVALAKLGSDGMSVLDEGEGE